MLQEGSIINGIYCCAHSDSTHKNTDAITNHNKLEFQLTLFLQTFSRHGMVVHQECQLLCHEMWYPHYCYNASRENGHNMYNVSELGGDINGISETHSLARTQCAQN
jgi:hypothetical protein